MSGLHAECTVTIAPTITPERVLVMAGVIVDKLFPGNAGGVHYLFDKRVAALLCPLAREAQNRQKTARARVVREGFTFTLAPFIGEG
jgi:hypothetical protein